MGDQGSVEAAVAYAVERFGTLDVLVNNASLSATRDTERFEDLPDDAWARDLDICLTGAFPRCKHRLHWSG